jgi:hypothetical protein
MNETDFFATAPAARRPIQCEGIARGPERMSEMGVSGSVNPQFNWGGLIKSVGGTLLDMI